MGQQTAQEFTCDVCSDHGFATGGPPYDGWLTSELGVACSGECEIALYVKAHGHPPNMAHRGPSWPPSWMT